jgi:tetrahydromethanopterin S-methyltransferase subunit H
MIFGNLSYVEDVSLATDIGRPRFEAVELFSGSSIGNIASTIPPGKPGVLAMATQIVMDHAGDTRHIFDENDAQALVKAEQRFEDLTGGGFTAATRNASGEAAVTHKFDPAAAETLFVPRLVGG